MYIIKVILMISLIFLMEDILMRGYVFLIFVKFDLGKDWFI